MEQVCEFKQPESQRANQPISQQQQCKLIECEIENDFSLTACHVSEIQKQEWMVDVDVPIT